MLFLLLLLLFLSISLGCCCLYCRWCVLCLCACVLQLHSVLLHRLTVSLPGMAKVAALSQRHCLASLCTQVECLVPVLGGFENLKSEFSNRTLVVKDRATAPEEQASFVVMAVCGRGWMAGWRAGVGNSVIRPMSFWPPP